MTKKEFLDLLRYYLKTYPDNMINDIVNDYEEHFQIGLEKGKTEEQICKELGSPKDIADEFINNQIPPKTNFSYTENRSYSQPPQKGLSVPVIVLIVIAALLIGPATIGVLAALLISCFAVILSLLATILALGVSGIAALFANFIPIRSYAGIFGYTPHILTSFFLGIFLIGLAILLSYLSIRLIKLCAKGIRKLYLSIRWKLLKRRNH